MSVEGFAAMMTPLSNLVRCRQSEARKNLDGGYLQDLEDWIRGWTIFKAS